jgi:hypothetical protein
MQLLFFFFIQQLSRYKDNLVVMHLCQIHLLKWRRRILVKEHQCEEEKHSRVKYRHRITFPPDCKSTCVTRRRSESSSCTTSLFNKDRRKIIVDNIENTITMLRFSNDVVMKRWSMGNNDGYFLTISQRTCISADRHLGSNTRVRNLYRQWCVVWNTPAVLQQRKLPIFQLI